MSDIVKITIATVVYNGAATIADAIESVVAQSYQNIEYIIVDGASKDDTLAIVERYARQYDSIRVQSEPDKGIYDAMNKALRMATGDFLLFLGSDDALYNSTVIAAFVQQATHPNSVYYGDVFAKDAKALWFGAFTKEKLIMQNISHQAIFYPKTVYKQHTYNLKYPLFSDWEYNLRVWSQHGAFARLNLVVTIYAQDGASYNNPDAIFLKDRSALVKQYFGSKYSWLLTMQRLKLALLGNTDLRKIKGFLFHKLR